MKKHHGINYANIPVKGAAGLLVAVGIAAIFLIGVPAFRIIALLSLSGEF